MLQAKWLKIFISEILKGFLIQNILNSFYWNLINFLFLFFIFLYWFLFTFYFPIRILWNTPFSNGIEEFRTNVLLRVQSPFRNVGIIIAIWILETSARNLPNVANQFLKFHSLDINLVQYLFFLQCFLGL